MSPLAGLGLQLRPGERRLAWLLAGAYFLLLLFYYLLKPARDSLFLVEVSAARLPWVYMLTALVAAPVTAAYARAGQRHRLDRLILLTAAVLIVALLGLRQLIRIDAAWVLYVFYAFVGVAGGLTTSQFWLLAGAVFDAAQAKRLFPVLGIGGIVGAFAGGEITGLLVRHADLATGDLLLVAAGVLAASALLCRAAFARAPDLEREQPAQPAAAGASSRSLLRAVLQNRHLALTVGIIALTVMTTSFVDYAFKTVSLAAYPDGAELTAFLGRFYGRMSLVALLVQTLLATRLIRLLGAGGVLVVLPAVLGVGAVGLVAAPGLLAGMALRGGDIGLKYSLDRTSRELLYLPVPLALKKRTKVFMDMFVDRWARGLAGLLLLVCTSVLGLGVRGVAVLMLALVAVWLGLALRMRREYLESFRRALSRREIDLDALRVRIDDAAAVDVLLQALASDRLREVVYALDMLEGVRTGDLADRVRPLLAHASPEVRRRALRILARLDDPRDHAAALRLLQDADLAVRTAAVAYVVGSGRAGPPAAILRGLLHGEARLRNAALAYLGGDDPSALHATLVDRAVVGAVLAEEGPAGAEGRAQLAGLPWLPAGADPDLWRHLVHDAEPQVAAAAMAGIGRRGDAALVSLVLARLDHPRLRLPARAALARLATATPGLLQRYESFFRDRGVPARVRAEIPRVLADVPLPGSVAVLLRHLATHDPELRYPVLKALGRLRARHPRLRFDPQAVSAEIGVEAGRWVQLARLAALLPEDGAPADLLRRTIGETQQLRLESVFRLLALVYPPRDVLNAYHGVVSGRRVARANAQEFLDNLLAGPHRRLVLSLLDEQPATEAWREAGLAAAEPARTTAEALAFLGTDCDPWLAACAIAAGGEVANPAADCYLQPQGDEMLTPIEKVLLLQNVDVFADVPTDQLAALAAIARELPVLAGDAIYREHDRPDALYLVLEGKVRLHHGDQVLARPGPGEAFGTWALFDDEPRVMSATADEDARLLRIDAGEFADLLADDVRIAQGVIRTVARRLRQLAGRAG